MAVSATTAMANKTMICPAAASAQEAGERRLHSRYARALVVSTLRGRTNATSVTLARLF
jgi:hypothetical protein